MTNWWEVSAAWAGAAGSVAAVIVALYIAVRGWRDAAARETRAQAQRVHSYTDWTNMVETYPGMFTNLWRPVFAVRNDSDQPIYQVRILGPESEIAIVHAGTVHHEAMTPEQAESFGFNAPAPEGGPRPGPYPVPVEFSDAAGQRWIRNAASLRHIRTRSN